MHKQQRINVIRSLLLKDGKVFVADLANRLGVTERTIRRDLKVLADAGIAELFFGGAKIVPLTKSTLFRQAGINNIMSSLSSKYGNRENVEEFQKEQESGVYVLGSFNIDIVSEVPNFPREGETIHSISTGFYAGGKGSNQATAAAKVCNKVHLSVKLGQDEFGTKAR